MSDIPNLGLPALGGLFGVFRSWLEGHSTDGRCPAPYSVGIDSRRMSASADISPEDWDLLFSAALELLARVAVEKAGSDGTGVALQAPGSRLRECMEALDRLRRSVPRNGV